MIISNANAQNVVIYSGACTNYKKTYVGNNKIHYQAVQQGFGKVVINRSTKKFNFFFDGKIIYSGIVTSSYVDDDQGGEGFSLSGAEYSAHRFTAERRFEIYYTPLVKSSKVDLGNQYEIENYKVN